MACVREFQRNTEWLALHAQIGKGLAINRQIIVTRPRALCMGSGICEAECAQLLANSRRRFLCVRCLCGHGVVQLPALPDSAAEPITDPAYRRAEWQRRGEVGHLGLDEFQLWPEHSFDRGLRAALWANRAPIERVPPAPVLEDVVTTGREKAEKLTLVCGHPAADQRVQAAG